MQIEEFQQESNLKTIKELTAFPMLTGNGVNPPNRGPITIGPHKVLFAPPNADGRPGAWAFIEPSAQSLNFLKDDLEALRKSMKDLGMQPLTDANLTVVTTANVAAKAHNAVQAWALGLKDALQQAFKFTALWLNQKDEPLVNVHTDFGVDRRRAPSLTRCSRRKRRRCSPRKPCRKSSSAAACCLTTSTRMMKNSSSPRSSPTRR
jgi:hypothetical protein